MADWWTRGLQPILSCDPGVVASESLTTNAKFRSVSILTPAGTTCTLGSNALGSTEYVIHRFSAPVTASRISIIPNTAWSNPSTGLAAFVYIGNSCAALATYQATSTALSAGFPLNMGTLTNVSIAACADLRMAVAVSSCGGAPPALTWLIDYYTTG